MWSPAERLTGVQFSLLAFIFIKIYKSHRHINSMDYSESTTFSKLILHKSFNDTIKEINRLKIRIPPIPSNLELNFDSYVYPKNGEFFSNVEKFKKYNLNAKNGEHLIKSNVICAYDESINKFTGLEGMAFLTSHSITINKEYDYIPSNLLTFYFYTRSKTYAEKPELIKYTEDPEIESKRDYINDRTKFIIDSTPNNSIMFIDGPLIGGQVSSDTRKLNSELLKKNIIPFFFVKNSSSNLVTANIKKLNGRYNSDLHWAYEELKKGQRTNLFKYVDKHNTRNAKLFCYLKTFDVSPQRIEFHLDTFEKYGKIMLDLMDLIYYLLLVQGDPKNPQIRPIAIAEKYARTTLKLISLEKLMKELGIVPSINQDRFGW